MASSAQDIPKSASSGRDGFAATADWDLRSKKSHILPTPPNSVSTSLPPCGRRSQRKRSISTQLALENQDAPHTSENGSDDAIRARPMKVDVRSSACSPIGDITPALLAKHHLPNILINHGPLAIRHILGLLTIAVPGFSGIPPTRARRLVVCALESRMSGEQSDEAGDGVRFEKVGWGRWEAKLNHRSTSLSGDNRLMPSGGSSLSSATPLRIASAEEWKFDCTRLSTPDSSWTNDPSMFLHGDDRDQDDDTTLTRNKKYKISDVGDESCLSEESEDAEVISDDSADMTDDEDWAALGAAALRANSYSTSGPRTNFFPLPHAGKSTSGGPPFSLMAKPDDRLLSYPITDIGSFDMNSNSPEREAIEALLRLGSV